MGVLIDDFTTGSFKPSPDIRKDSLEGTQSGTMLGGARRVRFGLNNNPRNQPVHFEVGDENRLNFTVPVGVPVSLELAYGTDAQPGGEAAVPVLVDLSGAKGLQLEVAYTSVLGFTLTVELRSNSVARSSFTGRIGGQSGTAFKVPLLFGGTPQFKFGTSGERPAELSQIRFVHIVSTINDSCALTRFESV